MSEHTPNLGVHITTSDLARRLSPLVTFEQAVAIMRALDSHDDLLAALKAQQARFMNEPNPFGHDCDWCGNCVDAVNGMRMVAIAKAELPA